MPAQVQQKKQKLLLILPVAPEVRFFSAEADEPLNPPLALGYLAALTPAQEWEIEVIDENCELFRYRPADLVGITTMTQNAARAYEIAALYRRRRIPVVMGGWHVSAVPEEAARYCDAVVVGEAETVWPRLLHDLKNGQLQQFYSGEKVELEKGGNVFPRRDIYNPRHKYPLAAVQFSRGCPGQCEFCSIPGLYGSKVRCRPVEEVLDELETIPQKAVFFVDDNFIGFNQAYQEKTMELLRGIVRRGLKIRWFAQGSINVYTNAEMLEWMQLSGCAWLLSGLESVHKPLLAAIKKGANIPLDYGEAVEKLHERSIALLATWIVGYPGQTAREIWDIIDFCRRAGVDFPVLTMTAVNPGSAWWTKYQDRLRFKNFPGDYTRVSGMYLPGVITGSPVTGDEWREIFRAVAAGLYSWPRTLGRFLYWYRKGDSFNAWTLLETYLGMRRYYLRLANLERWVDPATGEFKPDRRAKARQPLDAPLEA